MAEEYACSGWIIYIVYKKKHTHRGNSLSLREAGHNYSLLYPNNIIKQQTSVFLMMRRNSSVRWSSFSLSGLFFHWMFRCGIKKIIIGKVENVNYVESVHKKRNKLCFWKKQI